MFKTLSLRLGWLGLGLASLAVLGAGCIFNQQTISDTATQKQTEAVNSSTTTRQPESKTLTVYAYDSLTADYGLLPPIITDFEAAEGVNVQLVSFTDTGVMMNQLILEQANPQADVVMGLDNVNFAQIQNQALLSPYQPMRAAEIAADLWFDAQYTMTPFDFGYIGFVYDSAAIDFPEPISLADLTGSAYKDKIIIEQAGLSSPGTQLMLWVQAAFDANNKNGAASVVAPDVFWNQMADTVLTVAPDWGTAYYSQFLEGEAPIVLSYLTSPAYHIDQEDTERYKAIPISEGYIRQVEGIGVVNGAANPTAAEDFIDYILTDAVQNQIPTTQWMFPVLGDASQWPEAYNKIITPTDETTLQISPNDLTAHYDEWLQQWNQAFSIQ